MPAAPGRSVLAEPVPARAGTPTSDQMVERRAAGEPLQYVLGRWGFRRLDLMVDRRVLIPRPETEQVVEVALRAGPACEAASPGRRRPRAPVRGPSPCRSPRGQPGRGVGHRRLARRPRRGPGQPGRARRPGRRPGPAGRGFLVGGPARRARGPGDPGRGQPALRGRERDGRALPAVVADWEPAAALVAGPTGLEALEAVVGGAPRLAGGGSALVVEIAPHQAAGHGAGPPGRLGEPSVRPDLAGRARVLVAAPALSRAGLARSTQSRAVIKLPVAQWPGSPCPVAGR